MEDWYIQLDRLKQHIVTLDPSLKRLFEEVDATGFQLHTVIKDPYPALIGAIIGQKIRYTQAKALRKQLYERFSTKFTPEIILNADLQWLGNKPAQIIRNVTMFILQNNIDLSTEHGIRSLNNVDGIGSWTIDTTLLTCLKSWDIYPEGDKFLQARIKRLYGNNVNIKFITNRWAPYRSLVTWYMWRWF